MVTLSDKETVDGRCRLTSLVDVCSVRLAIGDATVCFLH